MSTKHIVWLSALTEYVQPLAFAAALGYDRWPPRRRKREQALQTVANSICNIVATDRRYPNEVRRHHPEGGRLVMDILEQRCIVNDSDVDVLRIVGRLGDWLDSHLTASGLGRELVSVARVGVDYSTADRNYLMSGRVWEMRFSLRSEIVAQDMSVVATTPECTAAVPYGTGSPASW